MSRSLQSSCRSILASLHSCSCKSSTLVARMPDSPVLAEPAKPHSGVVQDLTVQGGEHSHLPLQKTPCRSPATLWGCCPGEEPGTKAAAPAPISPAPGALSSVRQSTRAHEGVSMGRRGSKRQQTQPTAPASAAQLTQGADGDTVA